MPSSGSSETLRSDPTTERAGIHPVRRLAYADLPAILSIERRSFRTPWSLAMFVLETSKPDGIYLVAGGAGRDLSGYLICTRYADVWHLMNVAVAPRRRRQGIAATLIDEMLAKAGPEARITLEVRTSNQSAIAMYRRFGFQAAGVRKRYYSDTGEDAVIMWRDPTGRFEV